MPGIQIVNCQLVVSDFDENNPCSYHAVCPCFSNRLTPKPPSYIANSSKSNYVSNYSCIINLLTIIANYYLISY